MATVSTRLYVFTNVDTLSFINMTAGCIYICISFAKSFSIDSDFCLVRQNSLRQVKD